MTLYEYNQQIYAGMPNLSVVIAKEHIKTFFEKHKGEYFMLLNNELHYYTVIKNTGDNYEKLADTVLQLLIPFGDLKGCELDEQEQGLELWTRQVKQHKADMFLLFNYDKGVVEVE